MSRFVDKGRAVIVICLDFSKSFDTVSPYTLVAQLGHYGLYRWTIRRVKPLFKGRQLMVILYLDGVEHLTGVYSVTMWYLWGLYWDLSHDWGSLTSSNDEEEMLELSKVADDYKWGTSWCSQHQGGQGCHAEVPQHIGGTGQQEHNEIQQG